MPRSTKAPFRQSENVQTVPFSALPFAVGDNLIALYAYEIPCYGDLLGFDLSLTPDLTTATATASWGELEALYR